MKYKKLLRYGIPAAVLLVISVIVLFASNKPLKLLKPDPAFKDYVSAYTSGVVSVKSGIKIRLAMSYIDSASIGKQLDKDLFTIDPAIDGRVTWVDTRTLQFMPAGSFLPDKTYTVAFDLHRLIQVPDSLRVFKFQFHTLRQDFEVKTEDLLISEDNPAFYRLQGYISTADYAALHDVRKIMKAMHNKKSLPVSYDVKTTHRHFKFTIDSIPRLEKKSELILSWNGKAIDVKKSGDATVVIPGKDDFEVVDVRMIHDPAQCLLITFSDPLDNGQLFDGLVSVGTIRNLSFLSINNQLKVYFPYEQNGEHTLIIEPSVMNDKGNILVKKFIKNVAFENQKPAVRMVGEGTILPSSNGLVLPFEAVNLNAVDVKIFKIYEKSIPQFLQVNDLSGEQQLHRVGTVVLKKRVDLTKSTGSIADFNQWNRFTLDLADLIEPEKGAIYRVVFSFKKAYSTYPCDDTDENDSYDLMSVDPDANDYEVYEENWEYYSDWDYLEYSWEDYSWRENKNPCNAAYYFYKTTAQNILASDIGMIAKGGADGSFIFYTTDIVTAKPMADIDLEVVDFQLRTVARLTTDEEGKAEAQFKRKPFLVIAKRGEERGYLKLGGNTTLSMSLFDVDGQQVNKGLKGYLYAERGVWRPGDTMFINFMLQDKLRILPDDIPVLFELVDPQGQTIKRLTKSSAVKGIYDFHIATDPMAITGNYMARATIGNATFSRYFKVETVKPNRLKIDLQFEKGHILANEKQTGDLNVSWLQGAIAKNLKADVALTLQKGVTKFDKFPGFSFDNPASNFYTETFTVFDGNLDANGYAAINPVVSIENNIPGVLQASFQTKVFEPGGDFSINTTTVPYYPYSSYAGLWVPKGKGWWDMLETGKEHTFKIANVDISGTPVKSGTVEVNIYRIDWSWWWDNSNSRLSSFISNSEQVPVFTKQVAVKDGKADLKWGAATGGWGRYLIHVTDKKSGHITGNLIYLDSPGYSRNTRQEKEGAAMLAFSCDKARYNVGEKVVVTIPSSVEGSALVSIESGSNVLKTNWIETKEGATSFSFTAAPSMAPNVYVHVTLLQPHAQTVNDLPVRLYGVIPVMVEDPNTHLNPEILMADELKPESKVTISVKERNGKAMAYTLAVVDEGLLDLTSFKTPDPWNTFYGKEALGVKTWDIFYEVIGAYGGTLERLLSIGGGDTRVNRDKQKANRFTPVVKSFGPVYLSPGQTNKHTFMLPQYVGSLRVMVVASDEDAFGNAEKTVKVKNPLMVLGTLPRVVGPGETVLLPVNVFAMEKHIKNVSVKVSTSDILSLPEGNTKTLLFNEIGDKIVNFPIQVKEQTGVGKVYIEVTSGDAKANHTIEIDIRNPNPPITDVVHKDLLPGKSWQTEVVFPGMPGTNSGQLELSVIPPMNLGKRLNYLIRYPHGCLEQIVSAVFPQLYLSELLYLDERSKNDVSNHVKVVLNKLKFYMASNGQFSYWPGRSYYNDWAANYAGHFMLEAEKKGFTLPEGIKDRWINSQRDLARAWSRTSNAYPYYDNIQAYRLYTLALAGKPELGAMNRLRNNSALSVQAQWRLAAAYALAGKQKTANSIIGNISYDIKPYREYGTTFGSNLRDKAMILETMLLLGKNSEAAVLVKEIAEALNTDTWYGTQTTAYALMAVAKYAAKNNLEEGIDCKFSFKGKNYAVKTDKVVYLFDLKDVENVEKASLAVTNNGNSTVFVKTIAIGTPMPGKENPDNSKLTISVNYTTLDGVPVDPSMIQGQDAVVAVTVNNPTTSNYRELALTHVMPSGWEIFNQRLTGFTDSRVLESNIFTYQDIRDDRVLTYFNLKAKDSKTFYVKMNASYIGRFYLPAVQCAAMYQNDVYARTEGRWIEVLEAR